MHHHAHHCLYALSPQMLPGAVCAVRQVDLRQSAEQAQILIGPPDNRSRISLARPEIHSIDSPALKPWLLAAGGDGAHLCVYDRRRMPATKQQRLQVQLYTYCVHKPETTRCCSVT